MPRHKLLLSGSSDIDHMPDREVKPSLATLISRLLRRAYLPAFKHDHAAGPWAVIPITPCKLLADRSLKQTHGRGNVTETLEGVSRLRPVTHRRSGNITTECLDKDSAAAQSDIALYPSSGPAKLAAESLHSYLVPGSRNPLQQRRNLPSYRHSRDSGHFLRSNCKDWGAKNTVKAVLRSSLFRQSERPARWSSRRALRWNRKVLH